MTDLERHIIQLLLDNDCVIVPGFGGFMAHHLAASYDEKNSIYLPPSRSIGFNPQLTMNDSLLAQAYVNCYDISYPEALKHIENDVDCLKRDIESAGEYEICGIGRISVSKDGGYDFHPTEDGLVSPAIYGFDPLEIELRDQNADAQAEKEESAQPMPGQPLTTQIFDNMAAAKPEPQPAVAAAATAEPADKPKREAEIRIPLRALKQLAAACVVVFILLSVPSRLGDASSQLTHKSAIDTSWLYEIMPKDITSGKPSMLTSTNTATPGSTVSKPEATAATQVQAMPAATHKRFSIVLASRVEKQNAEKYAEKLKAKGMKDVRVYVSNGNVKVLYRTFDTRDEANRALRSLTDNIEFDGCWVTEIQ